MSNYRPKDWEDGNKMYDTEKKGGISDAEIFEAGADAMLGELRKQGYILGESMVNVGGIGWQGINPKSKWYSIPDEE